ncbi:GNAT family N-acetyltransferase [Halobacteriales archaeon QS_1_68_17]|nr:MAG: GNAT family N-acetyltransferase [Halobacteriales archaeon QS_1_68_17]
MRVAPATADDADALADLWVDLARGQRTHGSHLRAAENRSVARESLLRHVVAGELLVARDGDRILGFVTVSIETGEYETDASRGIVENLFVRPDYRNAGIGGELLAAGEELLADRGAEVVKLEVVADNRAARRFYRRRGYEPHRVVLERPLESDNHTRDNE